MRNVIRSSQFVKDYKRTVKRGIDLSALVTVVTALAKEGRIDAHFRPHKLQGSYSGYWECHLANDLLLVYELSPETVYVFRMGTHSDLFE